MKKLLTVIAIGTALATAVRAAAPASSAATFELTYRGLAAPDDPLSYRSYWGFGGGNQADSSFVRQVKQHIEKYDLVYNAMLPEDMRWSLVELKDNQPVAFYFDLDANGKLSDDEKILPARPQGSDFGYECGFITPDFMVRNQDGKDVPFRLMLVGYRSGSESISYMWTPCAVLEGEAMLAGEPTKMVVYANGFDGSFSTFRQCSVSLFPASRKVEGYLPRQSLSSLIYYRDAFYRLELTGLHAQGETLTVTVATDTTPTGKIETELTGSQSLKAKLTSATIEGAKDNSIYFSVSGDRTTFPAGAYRLASGYVTYGTQDDDEWRVNFTDGPAFDLAADETSAIELGELKLSVSAVAENDRYRSDVQKKTTFAKGTAIYITPEIVGKAGEAYVRFTQKGSKPNQFTDVKPHLSIKDPDGKEIVSTDLEYG